MSIYTTNNRLKRILGTSKGSTLGVGSTTIFIVILMFFFAILPAYRTISDQIKNNETKTKYYNELLQKKATLDKLATSYETNKSVIDYFDIYTESTPNTEALVANIDKIAKANNAILTNVGMTKPTTSVLSDSPFQTFSNITSQPIILQFEGKIQYIEELISQLESFPLSINIKSISYIQESLQSDKAVKQSLIENNLMQINVIGEFYFWNQSL